MLDWEFVGSGLSTTSIEEIASNETGVYLAGRSGIFISLDNGNTWEKQEAMLPDTQIGRTVFVTETFVFAGINNKLFASPVDTLRWMDVSENLPNDFIPEKMLAKNDILYVGGDRGI